MFDSKSEDRFYNVLENCNYEVLGTLQNGVPNKKETSATFIINSERTYRVVNYFSNYFINVVNEYILPSAKVVSDDYGKLRKSV